MLHSLIRQGKSFSGHERNCCFVNIGGQFANVSAISGIDFPDDGRGVAMSDWDHDGDLDLWTANRSGPQVRFLRNDVGNAQNFVALRLIGNGTTTNCDAIGARIEVHTEDNSPLIQTLRAGDGFMSQSSKWVHFGMGDQTNIAKVIVRWPGAATEEFTNIQPNRRFHLVQNSGSATPSTQSRNVSMTHSTVEPPTPSQHARIRSRSKLPLPLLDYIPIGATKNETTQVYANDPTKEPTSRLITFWSSQCETCGSELGQISRAASQFESVKLKVYALSFDQLDPTGSPTDAKQVAEKLGSETCFGFATETCATKLQLTLNQLFDMHQPMVVPLSILADEKANILAIYRGPITPEAVLGDLENEGKSASQNTNGKWFERRKRLSPFDLAWQLTEQDLFDDAVHYVDANRNRLEDHFNWHKLLVLIGNGHLARGGTAMAIEMYRESLRANVDYVDAKNNLAWLLATHRDTAIRDGQQAVRYAESAIATAGDSPALLDTLAAAYASIGDFTKAVTTAEKAIQLASDQSLIPLASRIEERLVLYRQRKPYRE